jgi:hypothetical protein
MRVVGLVLLLAGWLLVLAAIALLPSLASRWAFVVAGLGVEVLGLVLTIRSHLIPKEQKG